MSSLGFKVRFPLLALSLMIGGHAAQAMEPFDAAKFAAAQDAGKSVLVDVRADWCTVCAQQKPIVEGLEKANPQMIVYEVNFDKDKDLLRRFKVSYQSTLIMFKGASETGRSTGQTDPAALAALVAGGM